MNTNHYRAKRNRCMEGEQDLTPYAIRTQAEVARILGITRQAVHSAERSAIWKIRRAERLERLKEFGATGEL